MGKNICELSLDKNPGAANVFSNCGIPMGMLCLILDMLKGFLPVFIACYFLNTENLAFSLVMTAPILGHALGIFNRFRGGKCISTSFGVVLGLMPVCRIGFLLAIIYILFSVVIKISPHSLRSILSFSIFAVLAAVILCIVGKYSVALGCVLFSLIAVIKHKINPNKVDEKVYAVENR
jgi:glycerol-3-phosphate acyltransferase PlsY